MTQWSDDKIQTLTRMWNEEYTASQIAGEVGMSRSAVLGKAHRLNLAARVNPVMTRDQIFDRVLTRIEDENMTVREAAAAEAMPVATALAMWVALRTKMGPTAI